MICEPCGKNIVYHKSAACQECYRELQEENSRLRGYINAAYEAQDGHEQHSVVVEAMDYVEGSGE